MPYVGAQVVEQHSATQTRGVFVIDLPDEELVGGLAAAKNEKKTKKTKKKKKKKKKNKKKSKKKGKLPRARIFVGFEGIAASAFEMDF